MHGKLIVSYKTNIIIKNLYNVVVVAGIAVYIGRIMCQFVVIDNISNI